MVAGIRGQHDPPTRDLQHRFRWILGEGEVNTDSKVVVRALPAAEDGRTAADRTKRTLRALAAPNLTPEGRPSILLAHINAASFPPTERQTPHFRYYALGDMHLSRIVPLADGAYVGTPGHLYPHFDGSGKVWPTFMLKGSIGASGHVQVGRVQLQGRSLGAPYTRQLYVPHKYRGADHGQLVLVNAPADDVLRTTAFRFSAVEELKASGSDPQEITLRRVSVGYHSQRELSDAVQGLLAAMPKDIFVGLASRKGQAKDRPVRYGAAILANGLDDFIERSFMPTSKTQTSDTEGWLPAK